MSKNNNKKLSELSHTELVHKIKRSPGLIGLENIITASEEVDCYNEKNRLVTSPDIVFYLGNNNYIAVEVKTSNSRSARLKMDIQLHRYYDFFLKYYGLEYEILGVYVEYDKLKVIKYDPKKNWGWYIWKIQKKQSQN